MIAFIGLGSNRPVWRGGRHLSPTEVVRLAALALDELPQSCLLSTSGLYVSAPIGPGRQRPYINAVAALETDLSPADLLGCLHEIEAGFGRRRSLAWQSRTLDLDALDVGGLVFAPQAQWRRRAELPWPTPISAQALALNARRSLTLPHPRMHQRRFVLQPLAELCPNWLHAVFQVTVQQLLCGLPPSPVRRLGPLTF